MRGTQVTTENGIPRPAKVRDYIAIMVDTLHYQMERQQCRPNGFTALHIAALEWAIPVLETEELSLLTLRRKIYEANPHNREASEDDRSVPTG